VVLHLATRLLHLHRSGNPTCVPPVGRLPKGILKRARRRSSPHCSSGGVGEIWTMRSASRAAEIRSSSGIVGMTPPASSRDRAGCVIPALAASSVWDSPRARRRSRTAWPIRKARCPGVRGPGRRRSCGRRSYQGTSRSNVTCAGLCSVSQIFWACWARLTSAVSALRVLRKTVSRMTRRPGASQ
jgi:hypothetical protein